MAKRTITVCVDLELHVQAKALGVNVSQACEEGIRSAVCWKAGPAGETAGERLKALERARIDASNFLSETEGRFTELENQAREEKKAEEVRNVPKCDGAVGDG
jgi:hypothetical protein